MEDLPPAEDENVVEESPVVPAAPLPEPEPETNALTKFTKEWEAKLQEKIGSEQEEEKKARESAKNELEDWSKQREIRLTKKKEMNRSTESVFVEQIESALVSKNTWERVTKLVDITQSDAKDGLKSDVGRMRSLFVQLKNEPIESN